MKQLLIIAMLAFGMSATAQTTTQKDSLINCEHFQTKVKFAVQDVSDSLRTADVPAEVKQYAHNATIEVNNQYYYMPFVSKIVRRYPALDCTSADLRQWVAEVYQEIAIKPGN